MKIKSILILSVCVLTVGMSSCVGSKPNPIVEDKITIYNKRSGCVETFISDAAKKYLEANDVPKYLNFINSYYGDYTSGFYVSWETKETNAPYKIQFSDTSTFDQITYEKTNINGLSTTVYNLLPGVNYYRIVDKKGNCSGIDSFNNNISIRTIYTGKGIVNMRDLGGWTTEDNKKVNYSLLYRSAEWKNGNEISDQIINDLGIKTELDVRKGTAYEKSQYAIEGVNYFNYGMGQYTQIMPGEIQYNSQNKEKIIDIFNLLSDEKNYPLTYHCTAGADRTGTLSFLLLGMLGVRYESLVQDFELTSFYHSKRFRSKIICDNDGNCTFDPSGIMQQDSGNYIAFDHMYNRMMTKYGTGDNKLSSSIKNYLISECGVTIETINKIASIMLSEK